MADTLRLHVGRARFAPCLVALLIAAAPALSTAQGPVWNWARTLDAGNGEFIRDVVVEPTTGDIYVVGAYQASTAAAAPYGLPPSVNGSVDAFIAKLDPSGDLLWNRAIGSVQSDAALGVAVAASGEVAVTGSYGASIPGLSLTHSGGQDAFVILYDNSGAVLWTKSVRSTQYDEGTGVAISGNLVVAYGTYTQSGLASGVPPLPGLTNGRRYAYLNTYSLSGTAGWSLTGGSNDHIRSERIATDGTNVHVVGGTDGSSFGWLNNLGLSLNAVSAANNDGLFISSVSLTGSVTWSQMIDNPGGDNVECNGVAVDCSAVYITGRTHDGSTFPGGVTRTVGQHDYWFLASMNRSTGITSWVRTASSTSAHGITGYDIAVGRNGQVHVAGSMAGTVTTDAGLVIAGPNDADLWVSRFDRDGTPIWSDRQLSTGDEAALAIASIGGGSFAIGGWFENDLTLGSASYPGANGSNLFTASFTDPGWASFANNPARFARPDPVCLSSGPVDLNAYLLAHADTAVAFLNVVSPQEATGAPNSVGAFFTTAGGWLVLDLRDTLPIGEAMNLTWRSQTDLVQARMLVSTSVDAVNWTTPATYTTSSSTYGISNHMLGASARYIRVARHGTLGTGFHLDAVRFLGSATTGGTWSGGAHVTAAGIFSPGAAGSYPVTYTVVQGPCTFSYSRTIVVNAPAIGGTIAGGGTYCPGSSGTLTLSGHSGAILRWERSTNGSTWFPISNTTTTETWSGITGTMHLRVVVDGGGVCGTTVSSTATLIVEDVTPPVVACPADDTLYVASASCTAPYAMPLIASTDDCMGVLPGGPVQITVAGGGQVAVNGIPVQADLDLSLIAGSIIDLPLGANQFIDTIIDGNGNMTVCAWAITVLDTIPPEITCPSTIELPAGVSCKAVLPDINGMVITLNDNCTGPLAIGQDIPTGTNVVGGEVVHLIATDPSGNVSACPMQVVTIDTIAPVIDNCPGPLTVNADLNNCEHPYTFPTIESSDDCDADTESDYRAFVLKAGSTTWQEVTGQLTHPLPIGANEIREVHRDDAGNQDTCAWTVDVKDIHAPVINCPLYDGMLVPLGAGCQLTFPDLRDSLTIDDCSSWTNTMDPAPGTLFLQDTMVNMTMWVVDVHGNGTWNNHIIHIADTTPPTITGCSPDLTVTAEPGACEHILSWNEPSVHDNCPGANLIRTEGPAPGSSFPIGTTTIKYTADDGSHTNTCSFDVVVEPAVVDVAYAVTTVCQGAAQILPTISSPAGGVFSDADQAGTIDPVTGAFDPSLATPGLHTLGYVFAGACTSQDWFTIEVVPAPTASITYADSPFCSSETVATVTRTGSAGGTFTATPSLNGLSSGTGDVDITMASPGTYTVTYTIPASGACPAFSTSTSLIIEQAPDATISYAGPYCNNTGQQAVTFSGTAGGSFNASPAGLTLNSSTGQITPGSSACASTGTTYTVTYSIPAASACPAFSTSANVTITEAPWAGTNGSLPICSNAAPMSLIASVNGNPANGGSWKDPANTAHSGVYDPAVDVPGAYTYTVAGGPGCAAHSAAVQVTETNATLFYADQDGDSAGDPATSVLACAQPVGYVSNSSDGCPFDVNKIAPGVCGCGVADTDTDSDGTADCIDGCPNDPSKTSAGSCGCGQAEPGSLCDDGDPNTANDAINASCQCVGQLIDCLGLPGGSALPGTACDDGDATTGNDTWDANCTCAGQLIDCLGVPGGPALAGTACDDSDATTGNDTWDANCVCAGQLIDCLGVPGGPALAGTACDDSDATTGNDTWDANCVCAGQLIDCLGLPGGSALPGTACDDGDANTGNDTWDANCTCAGHLIDCLGVPGGSALAGTACDDGNTTTGNDTWDANCVCAGQLIDCLGVPGGSALAGTACDDGNTTTGNDTWDANCVCAGQLIDCLGLPGGSALPGTACDDGNATTGNDTWDANCVCAGQLIDCLGVPGGSALAGTACNDGDATTGNDTWDANCVCAGQLIDCLGVPGGSALAGTACDDSDATTGNDTWDANCVCAGQLIDCLGVPGGSALAGTACDDSDATTGNDTWDANCVCAGQLIDCLGVPGGPALAGTACDDGDATTGNDTWDANCVCAGQLIDCLGVPGGSALAGTACNDGDATTGNDTWDANCVCAGQLIDCLGVPGGPALAGTACDDSDATTGNDTWDANCVCAGQLIDCLGLPGGSALPGTACDDGDANTGNDTWDANCTCAGQLIDCLGLPGGIALPGTACDDGNANTGNDTWDANCVCAGQLIDCLGVPGGSALAGTACDDSDATTGNDTWDANCVCAGQLIDCLGLPGGSALPGTACDDGDANTGNDTWDANCTCAGQLIDCLGLPGGIALPGTACDDGNANTGNDTWDANCVCAGQLIDCLGVPGGSALAGTACDDGNANTVNDTWSGSCVCAGTPVTIDCLGVPGGSAQQDACGVCYANGPSDPLWNITCADCAGVPNGSAAIDACGVCAGGSTGVTINSTCADCLGVPNGSTLPGTACDDGNATTGNDLWDANCTCAGQLIDCLGLPGGSALPGTACNDGNANTGNDTWDANCVCAGQLIDCLGVPGGSALAGTACDDGNANTVNDTWSGSCVCAGTPVTIDCLGVPGGSAQQDACGVCYANGPSDPLWNITCADCAGVPNGSAAIDACGVCAGGSTGVTINSTCADCLGVPNGSTLPGTACDDGDATTGNDTWDANCTCAGQLIDCLGLPGGSALPGTACNDNNANTTNDLWGANCVCAGTPVTVDCLGVPNGSALPGTACDDGDGCTTNDIWDANCNCIGSPLVVDASFAYAASVYCETTGSVTPWVADTAGTFQSTAGLAIDPFTGSIDIGNSAPGTYSISHSITGACPAVSVDTLSIDAVPDPQWTQPASICVQQGPLDLAALVTGTPGGSWSGTGVTGSDFDPGVGPGSFAVTYTVLNGSCAAELEQLLLVTPGPLADAGEDTTVCGTMVQLEALVLQAGGTWSAPMGCTFDDPNAANTNVTVPEPGTYTFLWTVGQAPCIAIDSVTVVFLEPGTSLFVNAGEDQELAVVTSTTLSGQTEPGAQVLWTRIAGDGHLATPGQTSTDVLGLALGTNAFVLTASIPGCATSSDTVQVTVLDVFVPQGFSPNDDGVNDTFEVTGIEAFPANELKVFDRWGRPVFAQRGYDNSWDGRGGNGIPLIDDTYFLVLNLDEERTYNGYLIIKR